MFFVLTILALGSLAVWSARADEPTLPDLEIESLSNDSAVTFDFQTHTWEGHNGIIARQGSTILIANEAHGDEVTRHVVADGMVTLQSQALFWAGDHLEYNFKSGQIGAASYRAGVKGIFVAGDSLSGTSTNRIFEANNAFVTTDDTAHPGYFVRAKSVKIEGQIVTAREATLYVDNVPVFYLPYYRRSLGPHPTYWVVTPGYRSTFGPYLLTSYHLNLHENFDAGVRLDY